MKVRRDTLFLHMGPGLNCDIEKHLMAAKHPNIHFWDQPLVHHPKDAFAALIRAAESELLNLSQELGGPVHIVAHSFSGHLFEHLIERYPQHIKSADLFSTGYDILAGYLQLIDLMTKDSGSSREIKQEGLELLATISESMPTEMRIEKAVRVITKDPEFFRYYFNKEKEFKIYFSLAQRSRPLDLMTFKFVLMDFIDQYFNREFTYKGTQDITMHFGQRDPILSPGTEDFWKKRFPRANIKILPEAGHFTHLEEYL